MSKLNRFSELKEIKDNCLSNSNDDKINIICHGLVCSCGYSVLISASYEITMKCLTINKSINQSINQSINYRHLIIAQSLPFVKSLFFNVSTNLHNFLHRRRLKEIKIIVFQTLMTIRSTLHVMDLFVVVVTVF
jgi:hypothetical protein